MLAHDEDALVCDMAETYRIYDMYSLPVRMVATLASGLRYDSRIKSSLSGNEYRLSDLLLATIADRLGGGQGQSILLALLGQAPKEDEQKPVGFATGDDFEAARADLLRRINDDGH